MSATEQTKPVLPFTPQLAVQNGIDISCSTHTDNVIVSGPKEVVCQPDGHPEENHVLVVHIT